MHPEVARGLQNTFASLWPRLSCITRNFQLKWVPHAGNHQPALPSSLLTSVFVPHRDPPGAIFKRVSVTMRAHVRPCDPALSFNWHDDPPQEIRTLLHNLHHTLALIVITQERVGGSPSASPSSRSSSFFISSDLSSARPALIAVRTCMPGHCMFLLSPATRPDLLCVAFH